MKKTKKAKRPSPTAIVRTYASPSGGYVGFPPRFRTQLRYVETFNLTSALGAVASKVFRSNSIFDPNETDVGHQPMYYDSFSNVYGRYVVNSSKCKATFNVITETAAGSCFAVGLIGQATGTIDTVPGANMEDAHSKYAICNGRNGSTGQQTLYLSYAPLANLNLSPKDDTVGAPFGNNPGSTYKFVPWVADLQAPASTVCQVTVEIIYDVTMSDLIYITQS